MALNDVVSLIATVGFPIIACLLCGWYIKYTTDTHNTQIADLNNQHKEESIALATAINNNTIALQKLCDKMEGH